MSHFLQECLQLLLRGKIGHVPVSYTHLYHVDTETGEITRIENKPAQVLPDSAATPAGEPTGEDLADFGAWSKERENRLWEQHLSLIHI